MLEPVMWIQTIQYDIFIYSSQMFRERDNLSEILELKIDLKKVNWQKRLIKSLSRSIMSEFFENGVKDVEKYKRVNDGKTLKLVWKWSTG